MLLKGKPVSPGIVYGKVLVKDSLEKIFVKKTILEKDINTEIQKFIDAVQKTREEMQILYKRVLTEMGEAYANLFSVYVLILDDQTFINFILEQIKSGSNVEFALYTFSNNIKDSFNYIEDIYLKERQRDILDVVKKIISKLPNSKDELESFGDNKDELENFGDNIEGNLIIVANNLSPADTIMVKNKKVSAFLTNVGGETSHAAIFAQALGIPSIVGIKNITEIVKTGDFIIVNAFNGNVITNPTKDDISKYFYEKEKIEVMYQKFEKIKNLPAITNDGVEIKLLANIEIPDEIDSVISNGAEGIGLYRTEFLYMNRQDFPTEEEQYQKYKFIAEKIYPNEVVIRTIDIGGDKNLKKFDLDIEYEKNPFLGLRGIRFAIKYKSIFKIQLRAILRASIFDNIKIMYPMISIYEEFLEANNILEEVKEELRKEKIEFNENIQVGSMIEVPALAITLDKITQYADFFSIGTNDLMQYLFAIDRENQYVSHLYNTRHVSILRLLRYILLNAKDKKVEICGSMAGDAKLTKILIGLGYRHLSMNPSFIPKIKNIIREVSITDCEKLAREILDLNYLKPDNWFK
ncbi:MAG: phosphoenolpyruvate--protein phosphotransferase [Elusimicrobiota bacterium]|jgi:phosphotransferase system enzyme I (PtsI)|nr:phosphoenolpyruvate--protein phosphotransferase [Elusimicrobiota bacterium]